MYTVDDCFYMKKHQAWCVCVETTNFDAENFPIKAGDVVCGAEVLRCEQFTRSFRSQLPHDRRSVAMLVNREFKRGDPIGIEDEVPTIRPDA